MSKLLVIGNGFDLHCGLQSTYNDFFEYLLKQKRFSNQLEQTHSIGDTANLWWALFYANKDDNRKWFWKDIEDLMFHFLFKKDETDYINIDAFLNVLISAKDKLFSFDFLITMEEIPNRKMASFLQIIFYHGGFERFTKQDITESVTKSFGFNQEIDYNRFNSRNFVIKSEDELVDILKTDLIEIENEFAKYLNSQLGNRHVDYKSNLTIERLTGLSVVNSDTTKDLQILSFNYTRLGVSWGGDTRFGINLKNIHGTFLNDDHPEIIFGVDSFNVNPKHPFYIFTKTFRVSFIETKNNKYESQIVLKDIKEIIIYGHSLNYQDYSYFFAIFNVLNLNVSDLKVTLFYSNYNGIDRSNKNLLTLQDLIFEYERLFKLPEGLYHRLLLEQRIIVKRLS